MFFDPRLGSFLLFWGWKPDCLIHELRAQDSSHHTTGIFVDSTLSQPCPICDALKTRGISIVPKAVKSHGKLFLDWCLRVAGIVLKNGVVNDFGHNFVEGERCDTQTCAKVIWPARPFLRVVRTCARYDGPRGNWFRGCS